MIRRLKTLTLIIICLLLSVPSFSPAPVFAAPAKYAQANSEQSYFYREKDRGPLFAVPYTYCIEILRDEGDWYYARYAADDGFYKEKLGYCKKSDFTPLQGTPQVVYLYKSVTVKYSAGEDVGPLDPPPDKVEEVPYYGAVKLFNDYYSYVLCGDKFCYIEGANDDYPPNDVTSASATVEETEPAAGQKPKVSAALIATIVIIVLLAGVLVMLYFTAKKPRKE